MLRLTTSRARATLLVGVVMLIGSLSAAGGFGGPLLITKAATTCMLPNFVAVVRQGPSAGWSLSGTLALTVETDGTVTGTVVDPKNPSPIKASLIGQLTGRSVSLAFNLGKPADPSQGTEEFYLYGTGVMVHAPQECRPPMGGLFSGPGAGDIGDWDICTGTGTGRPGVPGSVLCVPPPPPSTNPLPTLSAPSPFLPK